MPDYAVYCPYCGKKVARENRCMVCGEYMEESFVFCLRCGTKKGELPNKDSSGQIKAPTVRDQYRQPPVQNGQNQYRQPSVQNGQDQYRQPPVQNRQNQYRQPPVQNVQNQYQPRSSVTGGGEYRANVRYRMEYGDRYGLLSGVLQISPSTVRFSGNNESHLYNTADVEWTYFTVVGSNSVYAIKLRNGMTYSYYYDYSVKGELEKADRVIHSVIGK